MSTVWLVYFIPWTWVISCIHRIVLVNIFTQGNIFMKKVHNVYLQRSLGSSEKYKHSGQVTLIGILEFRPFDMRFGTLDYLRLHFKL